MTKNIMTPNAILGEFVFAIETAMYQELQRTTSQRFSEHERVGKRAVLQNLGPGTDEITLPGYIMPSFCGKDSTLSLTQLRQMMSVGKAYTLIVSTLDGNGGDIKGQWVILSVDETMKELFGAAPQQIDFNIKLKRVD